jgi:hypothetical protein
MGQEITHFDAVGRCSRDGGVSSMFAATLSNIFLRQCSFEASPKGEYITKQF